MCHEHNHPHVLMLQIANAFFKLYVPRHLDTPFEKGNGGRKYTDYV